jgi:putative ABC transport system permease protein
MAAAKRMGFEEPVGKHIGYGGDYKMNNVGGVEIVGVIDDYHFLSVHNEITPIMIRLFNDFHSGRSISIRIDGIDLRNTIEYIGKYFAELYPNLPFDYEEVYDFHSRMYGEEKKMADVILAMAILAILIACMGVYGLVAFITSSRTHEVGVRKVMGAGMMMISGLFASEFLILIGISNLMAWPLGYWMIRNWLQSFPYQVEFALWPYLTGLIITLLLALISMTYHIINAIRMQPADSLRYE